MVCKNAVVLTYYGICRLLVMDGLLVLVIPRDPRAVLYKVLYIEVLPLNLLYTILTEKVPLPYTKRYPL